MKKSEHDRKLTFSVLQFRRDTGRWWWFIFVADDCPPVNRTIVSNVTTPDEIFLKSTRFYIQEILTPIAVIIGVIGNLITIAVLTQRRMKSSTNTYLTALAVSDLIYLICSVLLSLQHYSGAHDVQYFYYWKYLRFVYWWTDASSMWWEFQYLNFIFFPILNRCTSCRIILQAVLRLGWQYHLR